MKVKVCVVEMQGKSKSTCNKLRVLLGQLGRWAMEEGITLTNPAEELNTVAKQKSTREIFTEEDIKSIKKSNSIMTICSFWCVPFAQ